MTRLSRSLLTHTRPRLVIKLKAQPAWKTTQDGAKPLNLLDPLKKIYFCSPKEQLRVSGASKGLRGLGTTVSRTQKQEAEPKEWRLMTGYYKYFIHLSHSSSSESRKTKEQPRCDASAVCLSFILSSLSVQRTIKEGFQFFCFHSTFSLCFGSTLWFGSGLRPVGKIAAHFIYPSVETPFISPANDQKGQIQQTQGGPPTTTRVLLSVIERCMFFDLP